MTNMEYQNCNKKKRKLDKIPNSTPVSYAFVQTPRQSRIRNNIATKQHNLRVESDMFSNNASVGPATNYKCIGSPSSCSTSATTFVNDISSADLSVPACSQTPTRNVPRVDHISTGESSSGSSVEYMDLGDCNQICEYCHALFWYSERLKSSPANGRSKYNRCCKTGRVRIPHPREPPEVIKNLFRDRHFMDNIRAYNQMFAMTSFGAKVDESINNGRAPYVFKVEGQIFHWMGSLCPPEDCNPRFLQMYIYDTANELHNRLSHFNGGGSGDLKPDIVQILIQFFDQFNNLVKLFRTARDKFLDEELPDFSIRLYNYGTIGAIVYDSGPKSKNDFDIIVRLKDTSPQRINKLHPSYMALQFPLLFLFGEHGWSLELKLADNESRHRQQLTMNMFYSFQLHDRSNLYALLPRGGRLFQQYLVNAYICIEQSRLHGNPQYFITFTCNVKWPEIQRFVQQNSGCKAEDRPHIISRVFEMKVQDFIAYPKNRRPFGEVTAHLYTIEFQKRGLPHCHTLLWVTSPYKIRLAEQVDEFISAEIPSQQTEPELYKIVTELMMHGPCGISNLEAPCMKKDICSKHFPKDYESATRFDKDGYIHYRRRNNGNFAVKEKTRLDNSYVVPYNKNLSLIFRAHINVEYCGWSMMIKYLFKYISKGADRIRAKITRSIGDSPDVVTRTKAINEIQNFVDARYICPHEAAWRIYNFDIHNRNPSVQVLAVHLERMQPVTFRDNQQLQNIVNNPATRKTTLTQWLYNNRIDVRGRHLTYLNYLSEYRWIAQGKDWLRRSPNKPSGIGRLIYIHPACGDVFYLRMLLTHQVGCQTFEAIRTVGGILYPTYRSACEKLGLLGDDKEWTYAFEEAIVYASATELRSLFAHMLLYCEVSNPLALWTQKWRYMSDDIVQRMVADSHVVNLHVNEDDLKQYVLYELEVLLNSNCNSSSLCEYGLPMPHPDLLEELKNRLIMEERNYNRHDLAEQHQVLVSKLNGEQ